MILQFEVSGLCNMSCDYCLRKQLSGKENLRNLSFEEFLNVIEEALSYDNIEKILLYGFGEPGMNPEIGKIVRYASSISDVVLLTNGTCLKKREILDCLESITLGISIHDPGNMDDKLDDKLEVTSLLRQDRFKDRIELEIVLSKQNLHLLKDLATLGVNVFSSNMLAYSRELYSNVVYCEVSRKCVELVEEFASSSGWESLRNVVKNLRKFDSRSAEIYEELSCKAEKMGYQLNLSWIVENRDRIEIAKRAEEIAMQAREIAEENGATMHIPKFFADAVSRKCPYRNTLFVRCDSSLSPCMEFAYGHYEFVNDHRKFVREIRYGSFEEALKDSLKEVLRYPWCGDCQLRKFCWFAEEARDCYGFEPSCSECLYSCGIVSCRQ